MIRRYSTRIFLSKNRLLKLLCKSNYCKNVSLADNVTTLKMARKPVKLQKECPARCAGEGKQSKGNLKKRKGRFKDNRQYHYTRKKVLRVESVRWRVGSASLAPRDINADAIFGYSDVARLMFSNAENRNSFFNRTEPK